MSVIDISPGTLDSSLCFIQPSILHGVLCTTSLKYAPDFPITPPSCFLLLCGHLRPQGEQRSLEIRVFLFPVVAPAPTSAPDSASTPQTHSERVVWFLASALLCMDLKRNLTWCVCVCIYICRLYRTFELKGQVGRESLAVSLSYSPRKSI